MKRKKVVAFLLLAYHQPNHLFDLISELDDDEVFFFIHVDKKTDISKFKSVVHGFKRVYFLEKRHKVYWGGYSICEAILSLMRCALDSDYDFRYLVLLDNSCYPIKPKKNIIDYFRNATQNFVHSGYKVRNPLSQITEEIDWESTMNTYRYYLWHISDFFGKPTQGNTQTYRNILRKIDTHWNKIFSKQLPKGISEIYKGAMWVSLRTETANYLLNVIKEYSYLEKFFKFSIIPDESMIHTILVNADRRAKINHGLSSRGLFYVTRCTKTNKWAKDLDENDFEAITKHQALFARKFHEEKSKKLKKMLQDFIRV